MKSTPNQLPPRYDNLIPFCDGLQKKLREQVGHLHIEALQKYHGRGQIIPAWENDELCGYLLFNDTPATKLKRDIPTCVRIYQAAIQYDAQRIQHGTLLVNQLIARARRRGFYRLDCFVTTTIPANEFWQSLGFDLVGTRPGGKKRKRTLNHYRLRLPARPIIQPGSSSPITLRCRPNRDPDSHDTCTSREQAAHDPCIPPLDALPRTKMLASLALASHELAVNAEHVSLASRREDPPTAR